jgi:hypothetical protein
MRMTLRDEILVVSRYERRTVLSGAQILKKVDSFRKLRGDKEIVPVQKFGVELRAMAVDGLLDPWRLPPGEKHLRRVDDIDLYNPLNQLYYTLTYSGYLEHLEVTECLVRAGGDFRDFLNKKPGQS